MLFFQLFNPPYFLRFVVLTKGSSILSSVPDTGLIFTVTYTNSSPELLYTANFTTTGAYYVWLRGYASDGAGDSAYVSLDEDGADVLTGFTPRNWSWANTSQSGNRFTIEVTNSGHHLLRIWQREDGLQLDRVLLTTDVDYIPNGVGP